MEQPTFATFYTLGGEAEALYKDKGSKFLAYGYPVTCEEEIKGRLDALRNVTTMQRIIAMHGVSARKERAFGPTTTGNLRRPPAGRSSDRCSRGK